MMHTLIFADGALGAKNAPHSGQKQYFEEGMERKNSDRNGQKSEKSKSNDKKCSYRGQLGVKCMKSFCKIVLPAGAGTTVLEKCDAKSEFKHEKHKRGNLKLAFLMQIRIKSCPA